MSGCLGDPARRDHHQLPASELRPRPGKAGAGRGGAQGQGEHPQLRRQGPEEEDQGGRQERRGHEEAQLPAVLRPLGSRQDRARGSSRAAAGDCAARAREVDDPRQDKGGERINSLLKINSLQFRLFVSGNGMQRFAQFLCYVRSTMM